jgi:hypothetical protein
VKLFSLHSELGYFNLFEGQMQLPLLILGPRGFGKSELFSLFIERFNDSYVQFVPVASDGVVFQQDSRGKMLSFKTKGKHVSIRGKDNIDWDRKIAVEATFDKTFQIPIKDFNYGILLVGALGLERMTKMDYNEVVKERGHKLSFRKGINLDKVENPEKYLFDLIENMIQKPAHWRQFELYDDGKLGQIESEYRLIQKIVEYLPYRVLELTLPEAENKWGQLRDVFKAVVRKIDRLIISTVEYKLSRMIRRETSNLIHQIQHEWKFPEDKQLPNLRNIPEILLINKWLDEKVKSHVKSHGILDLPPRIVESIESGVLSIQTAFVEDLGSALKLGERLMTPEELQKMVTVHSIAIGELMNELSQKTYRSPEIRKGFETVKQDMEGLDQFLSDVRRGEI